MSNYEEVIKLNSELLKLKEKIDLLKPEAIKELYQLGYSMDKICLMLSVGKVNIIQVLKGKRHSFHRVGGRK